jgi:hypothetical protein
VRVQLLPVLLLPMVASASAPDLGCSGPDNWAAAMAYARLKNAGVLASDTTAFDETKVQLMAQEEIGSDLYRQIHLVSFARTTGDKVLVVTSSSASSEECSMSPVDVYVVREHIGEGP